MNCSMRLRWRQANPRPRGAPVPLHDLAGMVVLVRRTDDEYPRASSTFPPICHRDVFAPAGRRDLASGAALVLPSGAGVVPPAGCDCAAGARTGELPFAPVGGPGRAGSGVD